MTTPVAVQYMSRSEIERLMYSLSAAPNNAEAQLFEAMVKRLLELMEQQAS